MKRSRRIAAQPYAQYAVAGVLSVLAARLLTSNPKQLEELFALVGALVLIAAVQSTPEVTLRLAFALIVLFPDAAASYRGPFFLSPALLVLWIFALSLTVTRTISGARDKLTAIDLALLALTLALAVSVISGANSVTSYERLLFLWIGPYVAGRLAIRELGVRIVTSTFALAAVFVAPFLIVELVAHVNVFTAAFPGAINGASGVGVTALRLGEARLEGSFGQPVPLAMFLAAAAVVAFGLSLDARGPGRARWLAVALALAAIQSASLARTGFIVLGVAGVWLVLMRVREVIRPGQLALAAVIVAIASVSGAFSPVAALLSGSNTDVTVGLSTTYRSELLAYALRPGVLRPFGNPTPFVGPNNAQSIDNEYLLLGTQWGIAPGALFVVVGVMVLLCGWRDRARRGAATLFGITFASFVAIYGVALFGQEQYVFWFLTGACSGVACDIPARLQRSGAAVVGLSQADVRARRVGTNAAE